MRKSLLSVICACISIYATAQDITHNTNIDEQLSSIFQNMELQRVPTGYLLDRAVEAVDIRRFDGTFTSDNYSNPTVFQAFLETINSSAVNNSASNYDAVAISNSLVESAYINLAAAIFSYNYILANALTDNLISYQNNKVYDVYSGGQWVNPYGQAKAFVFTPSETTVEGNAVTYKFSSNHLYGNIQPSALMFDAGDGVGYRTVGSSFQTTVSYSTTGVKELKFKVFLSDNTILESHAKITVNPMTSETLGPAFPGERTTITAVIGAGQEIGAVVSGISNHSGAFRRPFIYVEGFDNQILGLINAIDELFQGSTLLEKLCSLLRKGAFDNVAHKIDGDSYGDFDCYWFFNDIIEGSAIEDDYDFFYVDFKNPEADIRDNATLLISALLWINGLKDDDAERNIVMGHSMGGLIARYALCQMELDDTLDHQTSCYVSFDSPHMGVNVPLGIQCALCDLWNISNYYPYVFSLAQPIFSYLMYYIYTCTSAKQMMYYYVEPDGSIVTDYHTAWQQELQAIGFPKGDAGYPIENLTIVNGGDPDTLTSDLMDLNISIGSNPTSGLSWLSLILPLLTTCSDLHIDVDVDRNYGDGGIVSSVSAVMSKKFLWMTSRIPLGLFEDSPHIYRSPLSSVAFDNIRSSHLDVPNTTTVTSAGDSIHFELREPLLFVPEASALAASDYSRNYSSSIPNIHRDTPFDAYYLHSGSEHHSHLISDYFNWIESQRSLELSGPDGIALSGDVFTASTIADYVIPYWAVSDNSIASISGGNLTVLPGKSGVIEVIYGNQHSVDYAFIYKRKTVLAGFPSMYLSVSSQGGGLYNVTANYTASSSDIPSFADSLANIGKLKFIWGYKNADESIVWTDTTSTRTHSYTVPQGEITHVFMKMQSGPGRESTHYYVDIDRSVIAPFVCDPQRVMVDGRGLLTDYSYIDYLPLNQDFLVWHNSNYASTVDDPDNIKIMNYTVPLKSTCTRTINGETKTVYCFDFITTPPVQSAISDTRTQYNEGGNLVLILPVKIRHGTTDLQTKHVFFIPGIL